MVVIVIEYSYDMYHSADKSSVGKKRGGFSQRITQWPWLLCRLSVYVFLFREPLVQ